MNCCNPGSKKGIHPFPLTLLLHLAKDRTSLSRQTLVAGLVRASVTPLLYALHTCLLLLLLLHFCTPSFSLLFSIYACVRTIISLKDTKNATSLQLSYALSLLLPLSSL